MQSISRSSSAVHRQSSDSTSDTETLDTGARDTGTRSIVHRPLSFVHGLLVYTQSNVLSSFVSFVYS